MSVATDVRSLPWGRGVRVVTCDSNGLIAIEKPVGSLSHPNSKKDGGKALLDAPYDEERQAYRIASDEGDPSEDRWVYLLNRLDSATSGLVLLTIDAAVRKEALRAFEEKRVTKVYSALVFGFTRKGANVWKDRLSVKRVEGGVRASAGGGLSAETRLMGSRQVPGTPAMSYLTLMPITGRTHQLRIQCAKRGTPIVGDRTYGDFTKNKQLSKLKGIKRLCLHCVETRLDYSLSGKTIRFSAKSKAPF